MGDHQPLPPVEESLDIIRADFGKRVQRKANIEPTLLVAQALISLQQEHYLVSEWYYVPRGSLLDHTYTDFLVVVDGQRVVPGQVTSDQELGRKHRRAIEAYFGVGGKILPILVIQTKTIGGRYITITTLQQRIVKGLRQIPGILLDRPPLDAT